MVRTVYDFQGSGNVFKDRDRKGYLRIEKGSLVVSCIIKDMFIYNYYSCDGTPYML